MLALMKSNAALLFAGVFSFVLMGAGQSLYGPTLPAFSRAFDLSLSQVGVLVSAHWVGCFIGVGAMFLLGTRIGPRITLAVMALGAAVIASGSGWWGTLGGAVLFGAGYGCATVVFNPRMLAAFGSHGPSMLSLLNATFSLGAIAAPLIFVALGSSPTAVFGGLAAACALVWLFAGQSDKAEISGPAETSAYRFHLGALVFGVVSVGLEASMIGLGPTALIRAGQTEARAAELLSLFFVAFLASRIVLVFLAHRLASFTLYLLAMSSTAVIATLAALFDPALAFVAMGFSAGVFFPGFYVTASRKMGTDPRVPPTIIAAGLVGGIASPVLLGTLLEGLGERGFFWVIAVVSGVVSVAALAVLRPMNR